MKISSRLSLALLFSSIVPLQAQPLAGDLEATVLDEIEERHRQEQKAFVEGDCDKVASFYSEEATRFLLLHGTSDDDVPFGDAARLMAALNAAGKTYDIVIFPEGHHIIQGPYWWERVTGYLVEHLQP